MFNENRGEKIKECLNQNNKEMERRKDLKRQNEKPNFVNFHTENVRNTREFTAA